MNIYVAARLGRKKDVRNLYGRLKKMGHKIVVDWTLHKPIKPFEKNAEMARQYSIEDINAARSCDIFILITDFFISIRL